jgi:hypothetical protein
MVKFPTELAQSFEGKQAEILLWDLKEIYCIWFWKIKNNQPNESLGATIVTHRLSDGL